MDMMTSTESATLIAARWVPIPSSAPIRNTIDAAITGLAPGTAELRLALASRRYRKGCAGKPATRLQGEQEPEVHQISKDLAHVVEDARLAVRVLPEIVLLDGGDVPSCHMQGVHEHPARDEEEDGGDNHGHQGHDPRVVAHHEDIDSFSGGRAAHRSEEDDAPRSCPPIHDHKVLVVPPADAVADPGAMVVHTQDAMVCTLRSGLGASSTRRGLPGVPGAGPPVVPVVLDDLALGRAGAPAREPGLPLRGSRRPRVCDRCDEVGPETDEEHDVEEDRPAG